MLPFLFLTGCTNDLSIDEPLAEVDNELPIEFNFAMSTETRAFDGDVKNVFTNGDVIHILGTFETRELQEDGTQKEDTVKRYGAMSYNGKKWTPLAGSQLTWPSVAVNGTFEAYYIYGSNGVLTGATAPEPMFLADIKPANGDPMHAKSKKGIIYGHAVELNFEHLCAYLTLVDLEPQVATSYWLKRDGVENFHNAFKFYLKKDNDDNPENFVFEFCAESYNSQFPGIYIAADAVGQAIFDGDDGDNVELKNITKASYFLEPGYYETFSLCYPATAPKVYEYLRYDYNKIPENAGGVGKENNAPDLKAGTTYTLTVTKSPGVIINSPSSGEGWHDGPPYYEIDVEEFLKAVKEKKAYDYVYKDSVVHILEVMADNTGTKLLENVSFQNFKYFDYEKREYNFKDKGFIPNLDEGNVFDGDYHYIKDLASPLFRYNYGTIKNIGIQEIDIKATTYEDEDYDDHDKDMSRLGALCMWNRQNATISNVRVTNVKMDVTVESQIKVGDDGSEIHNIGCVVGSNTGYISEVAMAGEFKLEIKGENTNSSVLIGGVLGQNAAEGTIYDVTPLSGLNIGDLEVGDFKIEIINNCEGELGSYSVGGVVGESTGIVSGVILSDVTIDGTRSSGVASYIGGIAGQLAVSENNGSTSSAFVESCVISGSVKAGKTVKYEQVTSGSYIGSISGADLNVPVTDCRTVVSVHGAETGNINENVIYATGGAFGRIRDAENYTFENLIIYGSVLKGPNEPEKNQFIGNFAGVVPLDQTWDENYSNRNILLRRLVEKNIGGNLDSNNNNK